MRDIHQIAGTLLAPGRGLLVADEYVDRMLDREARRRGLATAHRPTGTDYLETVLDTWGLGAYVSGLLMTREGFVRTAQLRALKQYAEGPGALACGVRMDPSPFRDGGSTDASSDVRRELADHREAGAAFAEWRAHVDPRRVAPGEVHVEAGALARGAAATQAEQVLPVVTVAMPDLASHSAAVTQAVTGNALRALVAQLVRHDVDPRGLVVRVSMVVPGEAHHRRTTPDEVARATLTVLSETLPEEVAGVVFLSGGQDITPAAANLRAVVDMARRTGAPWPMTFAFTRALLQASVTMWAEQPDAAPAAQRELVQRCRVATQALAASGSEPASA